MQCPVILDLLPLYVDEALSAESRALVDEHLPTCARCRQALADMQSGLQPGSAPLLNSPLPEEVVPSPDARFLIRLKRKLGTITGLALLILVFTAFLANWYGRERADRQYGRVMTQQREAEQAALAAIRQDSPDPMTRLREHGGSLTYNSSLEGANLRLNYQFSAAPPASQIIPLRFSGLNGFRVFDPATGAVLGRLMEGSTSSGPDGSTNGHATFAGAAKLPAGAVVELPYLGVYMKPDQELRWDFERPGESGDVAVGQRFTVAGAEFEVERVRFSHEEVEIDYRQLTDPARVGLHLVTFRLSDRMGGNWGGDYPLEELPDPVRPSQHFDFVTSLSRHWSVQVQAVVLALPGPTVPLEVK